MDRPEFSTDEQLEFLDNLREEGRINMFGAGFLLDAAFPELREGKLFERVGSSISSPRAKEVLSYWMETFPDGAEAVGRELAFRTRFGGRAEPEEDSNWNRRKK